MSMPLLAEQLERILPALKYLAEKISRRHEISSKSVKLLLKGIGVEEESWAEQELKRWIDILRTLQGSTNSEEAEFAQTALQLRGIPEANALLAIAEVVGPGSSPITLNPARLDFGELQAGQTASATVDVQGCPGRVVVESDKLQVEPVQISGGKTRVRVTVEPVEGGMLYSELRFLGGGGETRLPVLAQWLSKDEPAQAVAEIAIPPPIPEEQPQPKQPPSTQNRAHTTISRVEIASGNVIDGQARAAPCLLPKEIVNRRGVRMNLIPAGSFWMGSNYFRHDETPVHQVSLDAFYIDIFPVTNRSYAEFLNEAGNQTESEVTWYSPKKGRLFHERGIWKIKPGYEDHPVVGVNWYGAVAYCSWRGGRLPTEAEWEKAARGGLEGEKFPWGYESPVCTRGAQNGAQTDDCNPPGTAPVGSFAPNGYGLYDMAGNVWEWVWDWYDDSYYRIQSGWNNPQGPASGEGKVLRGGGFGFIYEFLRVAYRSSNNPSLHGTRARFGFRCAAPSSTLNC